MANFTMSVIMQAKIEACIRLASGKTDFAKAKDFKKKVMIVTGLTTLGFDETPHCDAAFVLFVNGYEPNQILDAVF